jgi:hypothetical protein
MFSTLTSRSHVAILSLLCVFVTSAIGSVQDDTEPDVTQRVARISFIKGDSQIKRADVEDWEGVVLNLPVVQGDSIATGPSSRLEIQFDTRTFLRISENSLVSMTTVRDGGIAVSVSQGSVAVRSTDFSSDREFIEIDAPKTTVAIQRSGHYIVEAGATGTTVRVTVTEDGEARVYSETSGFTLRDGRSATLFVDGSRPGEWDMADAVTDDFYEWSLERDIEIAARLKDAHYDKYYDRDIYGAEELSRYGEWIFSREYGYVWRPHSSATSGYSDWSPYRYGQWRWIPPYGWTWVNDEPWGWATYHHGRWVWDNGYWYWSPYGYYRPRRSWWYPALVVVTVYDNNVCWYPLGYRHRYRNYNRHHRPRSPQTPGSGPVAGNPTPTPTPPGGPVIAEPRRRGVQVPAGEVPVKGVVSVPMEDFPKRVGGAKVPNVDVAKVILSKAPDENTGTPILPTYQEVKAKPGAVVRPARVPVIVAGPPARTGAAPRDTAAPLDRELQRTRIFGNRPPVTPVIGAEIRTEPRKTGAVERPEVKRDVRTTPTFVPPTRTEAPRTAPGYDPPPVKQEQPRSYDPPVRREQPRTYDPPVKQEQPRSYDPPPRREEPRRYDPPVRNDPPKSDPPKQADPPPAKSEPTKPAESSPARRKDGK